MPFKSEAQRRWMYANEPKMAEEWQSHTPEGKLPERKHKKKRHGMMGSDPEAKEKSRA